MDPTILQAARSGLGHVLGRLACGGLRVIGRLPRETSRLLVVRRLSAPAGRIVRKTARRAGIAKTVTPTRFGTPSSPPPGSRFATSKKPPHMLTREPRCGTTEARDSLDRHATYIVAAYIAGAAR